MFSVILVDDEKAILQLIKKLIEVPDIEILGEYQSGTDAYDAIIKKQPDLVIADIYMAGISGIELIKRSKEKCPNTDFVIISGYRNFDDAYNAVQSGVKGYLLKPIKKSELNNLLLKLKENKITNTRLKQTNNNMSEASFIKQKYIHKNKIANAILSRSFDDFDNLNIMTGVKMCVAALKLDYKTFSNETLLEQFSDKISDYLKNTVKYIDYTIIEEYCYYIIVVDEKNEYANWEKSISSFIVRESYLYDFIKITFAIGEYVYNTSQLLQSYNSLQCVLDSRININSSKVLQYCSLPKQWRERKKINLVIKDFVWLEKIFEIHKFDSVDMSTEIFIDKYIMSDKNIGDYGNLYAFSNDYFNIVKEVLKSVTTEFGFIPIEPYEYKKSINNCVNADDIKQILIRYMMDNVNKYIEDQATAVSKPISIVKEYIQENYFRTIKLEEIASIVFLNSSYLCRLFKQQTGQTITEYITAVRIENAKKVLRESQKSIIDVSQSVGYMDVRHFSKQFIKNVGISPSKYRKLYR